NHRHTIHRRKPQLAITRADAGRRATAVALGAEHAVRFAVADGSDCFDFAVSEIVQLLFAYAIDAAIASHPKPARRVFENLKNAITKQHVFHLIVGEPPILETPQPAIIGADLQYAVVVMIKRPHRTTRHTFWFDPPVESSIF